ncbi:uncharacterized protein NPIL_213611 [Nephila pilipes]|uniref:Uncharacterized protein n=1 Tax=Nephila pilipes TaxID=299642 RepID=A0A8X6T404_NEPPI|nr:uncharacterized protein NPIL_213611 [Nephila pilipes]
MRPMYIQLVTAKTRLATIQRSRIPRIELLGAVIGARLGATIFEALKLQLNTYYWTDSLTDLNWIMNNEPWNSFVGNMVKEVRILINLQNWKHLPGEMNPSDLPSCSCSYSQILESR